MGNPVPRTRAAARSSKNPNRSSHRSALHQVKAGTSYRIQVEWALDSPTGPRDKLILLALVSRPGATAEHLERRTGMLLGAVKEALSDLLEDGWIYKAYDGGFIAEPAAEEMLEFPVPQSALATELAQTLSISA